MLGLPPVWYKAPAYRARAVMDPRGVLEEFGVTLRSVRNTAVGIDRFVDRANQSLAKLDDKQREAFDRAMTFFEDRAYAINRELRDKAMQQVADRGIEVYVPNEEEMAKWRAVGAEFLKSPTVTGMVAADVIERAQAAQE